MRRILIAILLLTATVTAQTPTVRPRWGQTVQGTEPEATLPRVTILLPTQLLNWTVATSQLGMGGFAESTSASPIAGVTWICDTCSPTSGTMTGTTAWASAVGTGALTVLRDTFTGPNDVDLAALSASPVGGAWSEVINTGTGDNYFERRTFGYVQINSGMANGTLLALSTPTPAISGTNYDVSFTLSQANTDNDDGAAIVFGYQNPTNYCAALLYGAGGAALDLYLTKRVAGTTSTIGTGVNVNPAAGEVFSVEVRGSDIVVRQNGTPRITQADAFCDDGSGVGLGLGGFRGVSSDDASTGWRLDDFEVVDQDATQGAINLAAGPNQVVVEACDGVTPIPNCNTATINVTYDVGGDSVDPETTITSPPGDYPTSTAALPAVTGTVTDNVGATSCTLASATTTPTSQPCTLSGTGTNKTFSCPSVSLAPGANAVTVTCYDAAGNDHPDSFSAPYTAVDSTPPVVTITTDGGNGSGVSFSTASGTGTITGTCTDAVGCTQILASCNTCSLGTVSGGLGTAGTWSFLGTWVAGPNVVSVGAQDQAGNPMLVPDTITVTYNPPLFITTQTVTVNEDVVLGATACMNATGGSGTKVWSKNSGTYPSGVSLNTSTGCFTGTPTTAEVQSLSMRVTDDSGFDDQAVVFTVNATGTGPHAYYESLIADPSCFRAYSFRPLGSETTAPTTTIGVADCAHGRYVNQIPNGITHSNPAMRYLTYDFAGDTDVEKQDALKATIPVFLPPSFYLNDTDSGTGLATITQDINDTQTTFTMLWLNGHENQTTMLIDNEMMTQTGYNFATNTITVKRAQFGTTGASHTSGTEARKPTNGLPDQTRRIPIGTDGSISATYFFTVDGYWTSDYRNSGLTSHKWMQMGAWNSGDQLIELKPLYAGGSNLAYSALTDVASASVRWYSQSLTPGFRTEPGWPFRDHNGAVTSGFLIKPSVWTRWFVLIEANAETDATKFVNTNQTLITPGGIDASTTQITMSHNLGSAQSFTGSGVWTNETNPFTIGPPSSLLEGAGGTHLGRRIRIDSEIMTIVSCSVCSGSSRTLTVRRGQDGTTPAIHALGAAIQAIEDYVTVWMADENRDAVMMVNRNSLYIPINVPNTNPDAVKQRGSLGTYWVEYDSSTQQTTQQRVNQLSNARGGNLVAYQRNFVMLKNPAGCTASDCAALLVRPQR